MSGGTTILRARTLPQTSSVDCAFSDLIPTRNFAITIESTRPVFGDESKPRQLFQARSRILCINLACVII